MAAPEWLLQRPVAHRGLHQAKRGLVENTIGAALAAISHKFAIECDVQTTKDGKIVVFHDDTLERLTDGTGAVNEKTLAELKSLKLKHSDEKIPTLEEFLAAIDGKTPLICEIKSGFDHNLGPTQSSCALIGQYSGPVAIKSFDPEIVGEVKRLLPDRPRGFIGESHYDDPEWDFLTARQKQDLTSLSHLSTTNPDFLSWYFKDLEETGPRFAREYSGFPLMTWTIRSPEDRVRVKSFADQIVFENFDPAE
jgi:glycerophosphoryl diester phosphodiesterase